MKHKVVNKAFCLEYIEEYCDRTGNFIPEVAMKEAATIMVRFLTKGEIVDCIPKAALEDAAWMAVMDAADVYAL